MNPDILQHMERHFGPVHEQALIEIVPTLSVAINVILPAAGQDSIILFTTGMSEHAQTVPEGQEAYRYTELFIRLPAGWPMDDEALNDPNHFWPFEWLRRVAAYPHQHQTWLGGAFTIIANDEPPKPLAPNTQLSCLLLLQEQGEEGTIQCSDGRQIVLYSIMPLYTGERDLEVASGIRELLSRFQNQGIPMAVDIARANVAHRFAPPPLPTSTPVPMPAAIPPPLPQPAAASFSASKTPTASGSSPQSGAARANIPPPSSNKKLYWWLGAAGCGGILLVVAVVAIIGHLIRNNLLRVAQERTERLRREAEASPAPNGPHSSPIPEPNVPLPAWVPIYPGLTHPPHFFRKVDNGIVRGHANFDTPDSMEKVKEFFETQLKAEGFEITVDKSKAKLLQSAEVEAKKEEGKRTIRITIHGSKFKSMVAETFEETASAVPARVPAP